MQKVILKISGMNCVSCAKIIKVSLEEEKGINSIDVDFKSAVAVLDFNPEEINLAQIKDKIKDSGYQASEK